jgi:electron transfer flavoprotein beta subunit
MKILVPTKRVVDTDQKIRASADRSHLEIDHLPFVINPFDAIALEEAVRIREQNASGVEVVAVGIGAAVYEEQLRSAAAVGADRAVRIACDEELDPWNVACVLKAFIGQENPDFVLMGKQAVDDDSNQAGQFLAAQLGWPQATFASQVEITDNGLRIHRETDSGIEVVSVSLPAIVTADLRLNEPRYASLPSIMRARKKQIEVVDLETLGVEIEPRVRVLKVRSEQSSRTCTRVDSVDQLLERLRFEAEVL